MSGERQDQRHSTDARYPPLSNAIWSKPATKINLPSVSQPGSSRTSCLNPLAGLSVPQPKTVAPMKRDIQRPTNTGPHPKRLRTDNGKHSLGSRAPFPPKKGLLDTSHEDLEHKLQGGGGSDGSDGSDGSEDPIDFLPPSTEPINRPWESKTSRGNHPSMAQKEHRDTTSTLPHLDWKDPKPTINRIANMKGKDGKTRQKVQTKPLKRQDITGVHDSIPHSSLTRAPNNRPKLSSTSSWDLERAFLGYEEQSGSDPMVMRWLGGEERIEFEFGQNKLFIDKSDVEWMFYDFRNAVICLNEKSASACGLPHWSRYSSGYAHLTITIKLRKHMESSWFRCLSGIDPHARSPKGWTTLENHCEILQRGHPTRQTPTTESSAFPSPVDETMEAPTSPKKGTKRRFETTSKPVKPRSTRSSARITERVDIDANADDDEICLVYPFVGTGGIQITKGDQRRLNPGEFLNDTLIEFGLRYWLDTLKKTNLDLAEQIHVFSPFFYKKLKNKDVQTGYNAVRKWTSKVDIFQKRYLVVPINERSHWYLAIIMYPGNMLHHANTASEEPPSTKSNSGAQDREESRLNSPFAPLSTRSSLEAVKDFSGDYAKARYLQDEAKEKAASPPALDFDEEMDGASIEYNLDNAQSPGSEGEEHLDRESSTAPDEAWRVLQDSTWLLSFDSLGGAHPSAFRTLKQYLILEVENKRGIIVGDLTIPQMKVPSPVQPNYCDCGLYVIKMAETFLNRADDFFQRLVNKESKMKGDHPLWNKSSFEMKREELSSIISNLSKEWKELKEAKKSPQPSSNTGITNAKSAPPINVDALEGDNGSDAKPEEDNEIEIVEIKPRRSTGKRGLRA